MVLEAVEQRFGKAPYPVEGLADNGGTHNTAKDPRIPTRWLRPKPCFAPGKSSQSNGVSEAFAHTFKRDYVPVNPLPDAKTVMALIGKWIEDYNECHPRSGPRWKLPIEFIGAISKTARVSGQTGADSGVWLQGTLARRQRPNIILRFMVGICYPVIDFSGANICLYFY